MTTLRFQMGGGSKQKPPPPFMGSEISGFKAGREIFGFKVGREIFGFKAFNRYVTTQLNGHLLSNQTLFSACNTKFC